MPKTGNLVLGKVSKTSDGLVSYSVKPADLAALTNQLVSNDSVTAATVEYADNTVGTDNKQVFLRGVTVDDGNNGNNYQLTLSGNQVSTIVSATVAANVLAYPSTSSQMVFKIIEANPNAIAFDQPTGVAPVSGVKPVVDVKVAIVINILATASASFSTATAAVTSGNPAASGDAATAGSDGVAAGNAASTMTSSSTGSASGQATQTAAISDVKAVTLIGSVVNTVSNESVLVRLPKSISTHIEANSTSVLSKANGEALPNWLQYDSANSALVINKDKLEELPLRLRIQAGDATLEFELAQPPR